MLHILWIILKTILIVLGILLGLVLLVLLTVLFCPIRYKGMGKKNQEILWGEGRISWLFGAISATASYKNGQRKMILQILGISLESYKQFFGKFKRKKTKTVPKNDSTEDTEETSSSQENLEDPLNQQEVSQVESPEIEQKPQEETLELKKIDEDASNDPPISKRSFVGKIIDLFKKIIGAIVKGFRWIISIPAKICHFFRKISLTIQKICVNIKQWKQFLEDERVRGAFILCKEQLIVLLKHISPRKIKGHVIFGFEDPSQTGQVLAIIGATCPIHKNVVTIQPVFTEKVLDADVSFKGRIYLFLLLKIAIKLYFDKNIKYMMKAMKRKEG